MKLHDRFNQLQHPEEFEGRQGITMTFVEREIVE